MAFPDLFAKNYCSKVSELRKCYFGFDYSLVNLFDLSLV